MRTCIMSNSIIHTCIGVKDQGSQIYASYIRASYVYASRSRMADQGSWVYASYSQISGYTHHGHMHYAYMHQGYMHYAFMHHGQMHPEHMHLGCMHPLIKYHICMQHTYTHQGQVLGIKDLKYMHHTHSCQDTCIMHTASCVLDTRILDACILDTCILDVCIMDTCILDNDSRTKASYMCIKRMHQNPNLIVPLFQSFFCCSVTLRVPPS